MDAKQTMERAAEQVSSVAPTVAPRPAARSVGPGGGQPSAPAPSGLGALRAALKESAWLPVAGRAAAIFAGMLALAGIGVATTLAGSGVRVELPSTAPSASGVWIAPDAPAASAVAPSGPHGADAPSVVTPPAQAGTGPTEASSSTGVTADGKVILNLASADELAKLPRVGAKRAQAILELRRRLGRFQRPTDLLRVRGIGRKTLKLMLPMLVVDAPSR